MQLTQGLERVTVTTKDDERDVAIAVKTTPSLDDSLNTETTQVL